MTGITGVEVGVLFSCQSSVGVEDAVELARSCKTFCCKLNTLDVEETICGSGSVISVVVAGVSTCAGVVVAGTVEVEVVAAFPCGICIGGSGKRISCIGSSSSVEVDAASSMYAELDLEKLPNGASPGRS